MVTLFLPASVPAGRADMRAFLLIATLFGAACYTAAPYQYGTHDRVREFDAQTTGGDYVRVAEDLRTGDVTIIDPASRRGEHVVMVDSRASTPLVAVDVAPRRVVRKVIVKEGSAGY